MTGPSMTDIATSLLREYHRRLTHYDVRTTDIKSLAKAQLQGELIGLRGALGIALGGQVQGGEADRLAVEQYGLWVGGREADAAACTCNLCKGEDPA